MYPLLMTNSNVPSLLSQSPVLSHLVPNHEYLQPGGMLLRETQLSVTQPVVQLNLVDALGIGEIVLSHNTFSRLYYHISW